MRAFHPLADLFPLIEGAEFAALVENIKETGLQEPIVIHDDQILDGRNRARACEAAGIDPVFEAFRGDDPVAFVVAKNIHRRHLDTSQRALIAAELASMKPGDNQHGPDGLTSQDDAATLLNVGTRSVKRAKIVATKSAPAVKAAVRAGKVTVAAAAAIADLPDDEQEEALANDSIADVARRERKKKKPAKRRPRAPPPPPSPEPTTHEIDFARLVRAWELACPTARQDFLQSIGIMGVNAAAQVAS